MHPKEAVTLWEAHAGAGSWQNLWTCGERSPRRSRFAGRACDPAGGSHCTTGGEEVEKIVSEVEPGKNAGVGATCF